MDRGGRNAASLGALLREYRHAAGLAQHELAQRAGISVAAVRDLEQGRTRRPRPTGLAALASALGLSPAQAGELERAANGGGPWLQILGPLAAWRDGVVVPLGGPRERAVLGLLALAPDSPVHRETIIDVLWPRDPPAGAVNLVQVYVSRLRRVLDPGLPRRERGGLLSSAGASYRLRAGPAQLDLLAFARLAAAARGARSGGDHEAACGLYGQALGLWRGDPLAGVDVLRGHPAVAGLARQRAELVLEYAQSASAAGSHDQVLGLLRELAGSEPFNERAHAHLMIALAGSGQQAEALAVYHQLRSRLDKELAVVPGAELDRALELVLRQDIPAAQAAPVLGSGPVGGRGGAGPVVPRQLPAAQTSFTGRALEMSALDGLLDKAAGTVVISAIGGTAGVGKTALAVHWARRGAARFPDGQLYVDLHGFGPSATPVPPAEAVRGFLEALGVTPDRIPAGLQAQTGLYRSLVAGRRLLIVLDNARDVDQVRPLLPGSAGCLVVVTSRVQLAGLAVGEGAHLLTLDVLAEDEARQLLAERLGTQRTAAEPGAVDDLIVLCARLPLALAVVAARAADRVMFSLAGLAAELRDAASRLDALDGGDAASSVRAVLSWSYQSLDEPAARMFRLLGVHPGPDITAAAAASLACLTPPETLRMLRELTRCHLLAEPVPGRYAFHDLLRAYAAEQARATDDEDTRHEATGRVLDHYLHTAHAAALLLKPSREQVTLVSPRPGVTAEHLGRHQQALDWFEAEHKVLLAALTLAAETGFDACAWQLPSAMGDFLDRRGHWEESVAIQRIALAAATRLGDTAGRAMTGRALGTACAWLTDYDQARVHLTDSLGLYRELGDLGGQARAHQTLGWVAGSQGRDADALGHAEQALELFRDIAHPAGEAAALNAVGWCHAVLGDPHRARAFCRQALALNRELGVRRGEAHAWDSLGYAEHQLGRLAEATDCYEHALSLFRELGDRFNEAEILTHLGDTRHAASDPQRARDAWKQALDILDDVQHPNADQVRARLTGVPHSA